MVVRFRVWLPLSAVLIVLLSIGLMFAYGVPSVRARLATYAENRTLMLAAETAAGLSGTSGAGREKQLELAARAAPGEALLVDRQAKVVYQAGNAGGFAPTREMLRTAASGGRMAGGSGAVDVAVVPVLAKGRLLGGLVFASAGAQAGAYRLFLRSGLEAAGVATFLGGGLMLLLATLLSRRVERLALGARSIEGGDLSHRIRSGFRDELGQLAETFNTMAARLEGSFADLEGRVAERTAELEGERARLEAVLRQMPSGVVIVEAPSGRILLSNDQVERIWRRPTRPPENIEEYDLYETFRADGRAYPADERPLARSIGAGTVVEEEEMGFVRGDGTSGTMLVSSAPIRDRGGRIVAGVAIFSDVTERRRAEARVRRLNEELEGRVEERTAQLEKERATLDTILNNLSEGVLAARSRGRVVFSNPAARSMLGMGARVPSGEGDWEADPWKDFDLWGAVDQCAVEPGACVRARVQDRAAYLEVKLEHLPGLDDRGGALVVMQDLSEDRRLQMRQQRFLVNAAHEFKTPITTILGASELLLTEEEDDPETRRRFLGHIFDEARRMQRLSESLLRIARIGPDPREPELEAVGLGRMAREVSGQMRPLTQSAGIELSVEYPSGGGEHPGNEHYVRADRAWLEETLLSIVENAVKHTERGGHIVLRAGPGHVAVEDDGKGISEEDLPRVFDRFYQGEDSSGGLGMGLAICKELVEKMGGAISVESEEGVGTKIAVELPEVLDE